MRAPESVEELGSRLGQEAVDHIVKRAEDYCDCERQRIEAANQAEILARKAQFSLLREREAELKERLRHAPPSGDVRSRRRRSLYYWAVAAIVTLAGFFFSVLALDPFRLGWKAYLYCAGIAIIAPFSVDRFLENWGSKKLTGALSVLTMGAALTSLVLLALIRGEVFFQELQATLTPVVTFSGPASSAVAPQTNFYQDTSLYLRAFMALLALAMEIGAGLALYQARLLGNEAGEDREQIRKEISAVQNEMVAHVEGITALQNEPAVFVTQFWRDFYRATLNGVVRNARNVLPALLLVCFLVNSQFARAAETVHVVIAVDLSKSVAVKGYDGQAEFAKNSSAVAQILSTVPAGSRVSVLGITDHSFAQPFALLSARISEEEGYFGERLAAARRQLLSAWAKVSGEIGPVYPDTDILGALLLAGEMLRQGPEKQRVLVIFSDMRHKAVGIDLESLAVVNVPEAIANTEKNGLVADLHGVEVYAFGVHGAGKSLRYWKSLKQFWAEYFRKSGATLNGFSVTRELTSFDKGVSGAKQKRSLRAAQEISR